MITADANRAKSAICTIYLTERGATHGRQVAARFLYGSVLVPSTGVPVLRIIMIGSAQEQFIVCSSFLIPYDL